VKKIAALPALVLVLAAGACATTKPAPAPTPPAADPTPYAGQATPGEPELLGAPKKGQGS
jgi:hypothetical protein